jgi:hypothetical protein
MEQAVQLSPASCLGRPQAAAGKVLQVRDVELIVVKA